MGGGGKLTVRAAQAKSATLYYWKTTGAVRHAAARRTLALIITDHPSQQRQPPHAQTLAAALGTVS